MGRPKGKLSKGQPRGARSASGRKRNRDAQHVDPCPGVIRKRLLAGLPANDVGEAGNDRRKRTDITDACDALGRAFNAGLLGNDRDKAKRLLEAGRRIAWQYWRVLGFATPDSLARFQPSQPSQPMDTERERILEAALNDALGLVGARGRDVRRAFDQLVIDPHPDHGPLFLDQIIWAHRHQKRATERDYAWLALAKEGLEAVA